MGVNPHALPKHSSAKVGSPEEYLRLKTIEVGACLMWRGSINKRGYGWIRDTQWGKKFSITMPHQLSYILAKGDYDRELEICHRCNNPTCVRAEHLYAGTHKDNMRDFANTGRNKGSLNRKAVLTEEEVLQIRYMKTQGYSIRGIAALYGIGISTVQSIHKRINWRHI